MDRKKFSFDHFWVRIFTAAVLLIFLFIAGCGGETIIKNLFPNKTGPSTPNSDQMDTTVTPVPEGSVEDGHSPTVQPTFTAAETEDFTVEKSELVVWVPEEFSIFNESEAAELFKQRVEGFERQYPGTVVVLRVKASSGSGGILDSLRNTKTAAANALPQIALLSSADMKDAADQALLLPVEDFFHDNNPSTYFSYAHEISELSGTMYGFPFVGDALVGIANNSFSDLGFTSWDEIRTKRIPLYFAANSPQATFIISQYLSTGGSLIDEQGHAAFNQDNLMTVLAAFDQNVRSKLFQESFSTLNTNEDAWTLLQNGEIKWEINWYSKAMQSDLGGLQIFQLPSLGSESYVSAKGWLWTIVNSDAEVDAIVPEFIAYFSDPQFLAEYSQAAGYLPVLPASLALYENTDTINQLNNLLTAAHGLPSTDLILKVGPVLRDATLMVLTQDYSLDEMMESTQNQIEALQTK